MKIVSIGGGPAGLTFAILMKKLDPAHEVAVYERNHPGDTFGWGVVFSDETLGNLAEADPETHEAIQSSFVSWTDIEILRPGSRVRSTGHGFCGLSRRRLLTILADRCEQLGVRLFFDTAVDDPEAHRDADLVLAADGVGSRTRDRYTEELGPELVEGRCRFSWLGTDLPLEAFTFIFKQSPHGLFQVHAYPFEPGTSTFIVECHEEVWRRAGLHEGDEAASVRYLEELFREELAGHRLLANRSIWRSFPTVRNRCWHHGNLVLVGDAAHTAHFSVGSGTKLAMEDAIVLRDAFALHGAGDVPRALAAYEEARRPEVERLQSAARTSREWFETTARRTSLGPLPFAFSLLSRSKRITWLNLEQRDPVLVRRLRVHFAEANPHRQALVPPPPYAARVFGPRPGDPEAPPLFQPYALRGLNLANRIVVSPMCQYSCEDGTPGDWHLVHLGGRALGGAGLVFTEATHVSAAARITPGCAGLYREEHATAWKRTVDFVHQRTRARIGVQLAHAGRKGSATAPWEGGLPLTPEQGAWPLVAPSPLAWAEGWPVPRALDRASMEAVIGDFVRATRLAEKAGFDIVELHMAHGYLLASFLSPLTNRRADEYGGPIENRLRFPLEVFDACRAAWPARKPMSVRISATDWHEGGVSDVDRVALARELKAHGCDVVDVSGGGTVPDQRPVYGRMYLVPFAEQIRLEAEIPTMAVGNITSADQCHTILAAGRADLCAMARTHLADPYFGLRAAADCGYEDQYWPPQYLRARPAQRKR